MLPLRVTFYPLLLAGLLSTWPGTGSAQDALGRGSSGPSVQLFTSRNSGGGGVFLLERPLNVSVSLSVGYDDNVNASASNEQDSFFTSLGLNLSYSFGTPRTTGSLSTGASVAYYVNGGGGGGFQYRPDLSLSLGLSHGVSERLSLNGSVYAKYGLEPDLAIEASLNQRSGNYFYTAENITATYLLLERWTTITGYSFSTIQYSDKLVGELRDRFEHGFSQQVRFLLLPVTTVITEYRIGLVRYEAPDRDSTTQSLLLGLDQSIGPRTQGSLRVGAEFRSSDQGDRTAINPYADASLNFTVGERTTLSWTARYSTEESEIIASPDRKTFRTGLSLGYGLTPRISSSLSAYYRHDVNSGSPLMDSSEPGFTEDALDLSLALSYAINPRISANASYSRTQVFSGNRTEVFSDFGSRAYSRNRYSVGLSVSF